MRFFKNIRTEIISFPNLEDRQAFQPPKNVKNLKLSFPEFHELKKFQEILF